MNEETIRCTSCNKGLLHFFIKDKEKPATVIKIKNCPFCGNNTIVKSIGGSYCLGPIGTDESKTHATLLEDLRPIEKTNVWLATVRKFNEEDK